MADEAKIKVDVEGAAEAERKLKKIKDGFKDWGRELGGIAAGMVNQLGSMSMELTRVDPSAAAQRFRDFRQTVTESSIASGRSIGSLKNQFASLSDRTLLPDEQVAKFAGTLAQTTYDFGDSSKAMEALRGSGLAAGRSLEDMGGVATTLHNSMSTSFDDMPEMLGRIEASAKAMGTTGGPAALMDDLTQLNGILSQVSIAGKRSANDMVAVLAALGKGRSVEQAKAVQGALLNRFVSGGEQMRLNLGVKRQDWYDEKGNVRVNANSVQRLKDFYLKRTGGDAEKAQSLASFSGNLGPQLASALFRPGLMADMKTAATATPTGEGIKALSDLLNSDHGKEQGGDNRRKRDDREGLGAASNASQQMAAGMMPDDSAARYLVGGIAGGMASAVTSTLITGAFGAAAKKAAESLFSVAVSGDKAALVVKGLAGAGSEATFGVAAAAVGSVAVPVGVAVLAAKAETGIRDGLLGAFEKQKAEHPEQYLVKNDDYAAGRKKILQHWYGTEYEEPVAKGGEAAAARENQNYFAEKGLTLRPPVEVTVKIEDSSGHPISATALQKGQAGRQ